MMNISEYTLPPVLQPENVHLMARSYTSPCFTLRSWTLILTYLDPSFALTTAANRSLGQHIYEQKKLRLFKASNLRGRIPPFATSRRPQKRTWRCSGDIA